MTKYRVVQQGDDDDINIIMEDGGVAFYHSSSGEYILMEFYGDRITPDITSENIWDKLSEGQMWSEEFPLDTLKDELITCALNWLRPAEDTFMHDNTLFLNIFP